MMKAELMTVTQQSIATKKIVLASISNLVDLANMNILTNCTDCKMEEIIVHKKLIGSSIILECVNNKERHVG